MASFPISSFRAFASMFTKAFTEVGTPLVQAALAVAPVTVTTASANVANTKARVYLMNSGSAQTLTVPQNLDKVAIGDTITVAVLGAGQVTLAAGSGVTIVKVAATLKSAAQNSVLRLTKTAANTYVADGNFASS